MKRDFFLLAVGVLTSFFGFSCGSAKNAKGTSAGAVPWQTNPVKADGNNEEWPQPYTYMDDKAKIQYSLSNDRERLYITMKTSDRMVKMKILTSGMQLWIDPRAKRNKETSIYYPHPNDQHIQLPKGGPDDKRSENAVRNAERKMIAAAREVSLVGFEKCSGGYLLAQENACGVVVRADINDLDELVWEAAIPFKAFYKEVLDESDAMHAISICFEINNMTVPAGGPGGLNNEMRGGPPAGMPGGGQGMGGGPAGGMAGGFGGGMGPGRGGVPPSDMNANFERTSTWVRFGLAYKP